MPVGSSAKTTSGRPDEGAGARHPLLLAAGQLARPVAEPVAQADGVDDLVEPRGVRAPPGDGRRQHDVLLRREGRHEVEGLEDEADPVAAQLGEVLAP